MFSKVIVSEVIHGKSHVTSYRAICKISTDDGKIKLSDGIYTWEFKIANIVSLVIV